MLFPEWPDLTDKQLYLIMACVFIVAVIWFKPKYDRKLKDILNSKNKSNAKSKKATSKEKRPSG